MEEEEDEIKKWMYGNKSAKSRHRSEIETLGNERRGKILIILLRFHLKSVNKIIITVIFKPKL